MFKKLILSLLLLVCSTQAAQNFTKFSAYPRATSLTDYDLFLTATYSSGAYTTNKAISFTNLVTQLTSIIATGGTTINVGGSPVSGPNFVGTQFSASGTDVSIKTNALLIQPVLHEPIITNYVNANHTHENSDEGGTLDAAAIISGVFPIARLATGTPDGTKFIRDDGTLAVPAGGGGGTSVYVNGSTVSNPNIATGTNTVVAVANSTNIYIFPTNIVNNQISASAAIARSKIATGSGGAVVINDGSGVLSSEPALATSRGGFGDDISLWTDGILQIASGVPSSVAIVPAANLGTGSSIATKYLRGDNTWQTLATGSGDVTGPASSSDNAVALFDGTGGKTLKNSGILKNTISASGDGLTIPGYLWARGSPSSGLFDNDVNVGGVLNAGGAMTVGGANVVLTNSHIGTATAATPPADDNDTSVATTAYVQTEIATFNSGLPGQTIVFNSSGTPTVTNVNQYYPGYFTNGITRLIGEGDSMMIGGGGTTATNNPLGRFSALYAPANFQWFTNAAVGGQTLATIATQYAAEIEPLAPASGTNAVLFLWAGINDIAAGTTGASLYTTWSNYCVAAKADGFYIVAFKLNPFRGQTDSMKAQMGIFNNSLEDSAGLWDALVNVPALVPPPPGTTLYSDHIHFAQTGNEIIAYGMDRALRGGYYAKYPRYFQGWPNDFTGESRTLVDRGQSSSMFGQSANPGYRLTITGDAGHFFGRVMDSSGILYDYIHNGAGNIDADDTAVTYTSSSRTMAIDADWTFSIGGGTAIDSVLTATATLDFPSTAAQTSSDLTITVTGAAANNIAMVGPPTTVNANTSYTAWVSAADTVTVRFNNYSAAPVDPASATFRATVIKY
jgi:hypothetical protein